MSSRKHFDTLFNPPRRIFRYGGHSIPIDDDGVTNKKILAAMTEIFPELQNAQLQEEWDGYGNIVLIPIPRIYNITQMADEIEIVESYEPIIGSIGQLGVPKPTPKQIERAKAAVADTPTEKTAGNTRWVDDRVVRGGRGIISPPPPPKPFPRPLPNPFMDTPQHKKTKYDIIVDIKAEMKKQLSAGNLFEALLIERAIGRMYMPFYKRWFWNVRMKAFNWLLRDSSLKEAVH